ncbi:amylo-alpha-1,6-glucosidase [Mycoplasmatota bacterium]|nr:amylo-alpha-1,6-glucosidase [Mycoplasmatota bacterium]
MNFGKGFFKTFSQGLEREWMISNGLGGYAGNSIINANFRSHHGYLIASLKPPVSRVNVLAKTDEELILNKNHYSLATNQMVGWTDEGQKRLQRFSFEDYPIFHYQVNDCLIEKSIALKYGENTVAITYKIKNGKDAGQLVITPFFNNRDCGDTTHPSQINFKTKMLEKEVQLTSLKHKDLTIKFNTSDGQFRQSNQKYKENLVYGFDIKTGSTSVDNHFTPYQIVVSIDPYEEKNFYCICTIENKTINENGFQIVNDYKKRMNRLVNIANINNNYANRLVKASDHFICSRESTELKTILAGFPWFTDWGRDTMIAMQGLTLVTKRFQDAKEILLSFSKYIKNGLVPNMFPEENQEPLYNTVDASLWYFHSIDQYLKYTKDIDFVKSLYPKLKEIIHAYEHGTSFSIYMDDDYLIHAGSGLDQVTWMDVRVNGYVVTPRHGKPVEINALWYNALSFMSELANQFGEDNPYGDLAEKVKQSFNSKFWNEKDHCLYDVIDEKDDSIRPNQIYAVSLPRTMLNKEKEKQIVDCVYQNLYNTYGLRSLSPQDPKFIPNYEGKLINRDMAYHMGTTWGFLIGGFITAYCKVNDYNKEALLKAKYMLELFEDHMNDGCINGIAEIFDGLNPSEQRGCYSQAWSVGEVLRAYVEDVLTHLKEK